MSGRLFVSLGPDKILNDWYRYFLFSYPSSPISYQFENICINMIQNISSLTAAACCMLPNKEEEEGNDSRETVKHAHTCT